MSLISSHFCSYDNRRYFVLKEDCLFYFRDKSESVPLGLISLDDCLISQFNSANPESNTPNKKKQNYSFGIYTKGRYYPILRRIVIIKIQLFDYNQFNAFLLLSISISTYPARAYTLLAETLEELESWVETLNKVTKTIQGNIHSYLINDFSPLSSSLLLFSFSISFILIRSIISYRTQIGIYIGKNQSGSN